MNFRKNSHSLVSKHTNYIVTKRMLHWPKKRPINKWDKTEKPRKKNVKWICSVDFQYEGLDNSLGGRINKHWLDSYIITYIRMKLDCFLIPDTKLGKMSQRFKYKSQTLKRNDRGKDLWLWNLQHFLRYENRTTNNQEKRDKFDLMKIKNIVPQKCVKQGSLEEHNL